MKAIFLDCGARGPQLKRNPLGSTSGEDMTRSKAHIYVTPKSGAGISRRQQARRRALTADAATALIISLASVVVGCRQTQARSPSLQTRSTEPMVPVKVLYSSPNSAVGRALREVIDNPDEFKRLWDEAHERTASMQIVPKVDFTREMVIVAAMGWQASTGSEIAITGVRDSSNTLEVTVELRPSPVGCDTFPAVTLPIVIVSVPSTRSTVVFKDRIIQKKC